MLNVWPIIFLVFKCLSMCALFVVWLKHSRNHAASTMAQRIIIVFLGVLILPLGQILLPQVIIPVVPAGMWSWFVWDITGAARIGLIVLIIYAAVVFGLILLRFWHIAKALSYVESAVIAPDEVQRLHKKIQHQTQYLCTSKVLVANVQGPCTLGLFNPVILLPLAYTDWREETLARVLMHELEHVRRHDWFWQNTLHVLAASMWLLPFVGYLKKKLLWFCELNADDAVVRMTNDRTGYASDLLMISEENYQRAKNILAVAPLIDGSYCFERISAVLDGSRVRDYVKERNPCGLVLLALLVWLPLAVLSPSAYSVPAYSAPIAMPTYPINFALEHKQEIPSETIACFLNPLNTYPVFNVVNDLEEVVISVAAEREQEYAQLIASLMQDEKLVRVKPVVEPAVKVHGFVAVRSVIPQYPRNATLKNIEGQVVVQFTVLRNGLAADIRIVMAQPAGFFESSVIKAVEASRFKPARVNGEVVDTHHATQTFTFSLAPELPIKTYRPRIGTPIQTAAFTQ